MLRDVDIEKLSQRFDAQLIVAATVVYLILTHSVYVIGVLGVVLKILSLVPFLALMLLKGSDSLRYALILSFVGSALLGGVQSAFLNVALELLPVFFLSLGFKRTKNFGEALTLVIGYLLALNFSMGCVEFYASDFLVQLNHLLEKTPLGVEQKDVLSELINFVPFVLSLSVLIQLAVGILVTKSVPFLSEKFQKTSRYFQHWDIPAVGLMILSLVLGNGPEGLIAKNLSLGCLMGVCALGLHIFHLWVKNYDNAKVWFGVFIVSGFLFVWPFVVTLALGFLDPWYSLTRKLQHTNNIED